MATIGHGSLLGHRVHLNGAKELKEVDLRQWLMENPMTERGDIIIGDTGGATMRLGVGEEKQVLTVDGGKPEWKVPVIPSETAYYYNEFQQPNPDPKMADPINHNSAATIDLSVHGVGQSRGQEKLGAHDVEFDMFLEGSYTISGNTLYVACRMKIEFMVLVLEREIHYSSIKTLFHGLKPSEISKQFTDITDQDFRFLFESNKLIVQNRLQGTEIPVYMKYNYRVRHYETLTQ